MRTYSPAPSIGTFSVPDPKKFYLFNKGSWGIVFNNLKYEVNKYKTFCAISGYPWASYEADTLEELLHNAHMNNARIYEFNTMRELFEHILKS